MSKWQSVLQEHTAARTRTILDRGLFSDVDIIVQGQLFHCHRYVLAQHSQFFFSELLKTQTPLSQTRESSVSQRSVILERQEFISDDDLPSANGADTPEFAGAEVDSYKQQQEKLLEGLGKPAGTASLKETSKGSQSFKNKHTVFGEEEKRSPYTLKLDPHISDSNSSGIRFESSSSEQKNQQASPSKKEEQLQERLSLKINFLTPETFRAVIEAIYYGQDTLTTANAVNIYKASNRLQIPSLLKYSEQVIIQLLHCHTLDPTDILYDPQMAENSNILQSALDILLTDFGPDSSKADWFLKLSADKLFSVLTDPRLNVRNEDEVYRALMDWYQHDPYSRGRYVLTGLTLLRLANLNKRILVEEILPHPLCSGSLQTLQEGSGAPNGEGSDVSLAGKLVRQALAYHLLPDRRHDELLPVADFRPSQDWERVLLVLGDQSAQLYAFSFARRAWFRLAPPPKALGLGVAACTHGDDLYVSGGDKAMSGCYRYRAEVNAWTQMAGLKVGRRSHVCVAVGDNLYVLGGKDDKQSFKKDTLDSVEVFHIRDKAQGWQLVTKSTLVVPVRSMACVVHGENIYVFGGRTNGFQQSVDAIQCFDTRTQQCTLVGHLSSPSCLARSFVVNKVINLLEANGDVLCFHPKNLPHKGAASSTSSSAPQRTSQQANMRSPHSLQQEAEISLEDMPQPNLPDFAAEPAISKVGRILNLDWKWFGVARSHEGTLYIVAGECPPNFVASSLSAASADHDVGEVFRQVRFICPEKMVMCYVSSHMCMPKSFLVEKLV